MLKKRTRSHQKDQHMNNLMPDAISESYFHSDNFSQKHKSNSIFNVPGLFVGFNPKSSDSDSVRSPTSPLDFRIFSSFGNPFRCPRSQNEGYHKRWDCSKVGLSIIDALDDETKHLGKVTQSSDSKSIILGRQMSIKNPNFVSRVNSLESPKSLPKNVVFSPNTRAKPANNLQKGSSDVVFEIGEASFEPESGETFRARSLDSIRRGPHLTNFVVNRKSRLGSGNLVPEIKTNQMPTEFGVSLELGDSSGEKPSSIHYGNGFIGSIPPSEIELSEDYTCVRTHGPNPKVTHIFGDCILECHNDEVTTLFKKSDDEDDIIIPEAGGPTSDVLAPYPPMDFLKFCHSCQKKLDGEDIYMYRGEKAFCSYICRSREIEIDEEMEKKSNTDPCEIFEEEISRSNSLFINT
ncbi:hypothetical protein BUALT_Bualt10G0109600 [Buddleja alternifolia]|uniref:FLZ-type domain-containing protein n=1 Tax=Buddleja alternifolia TaxID=168488 RepID=A0AAV6X8N3_9LAMI|nr:hypothetical protein BUALT_Bualt10G0109600 [Buddleja alternifolia]